MMHCIALDWTKTMMTLHRSLAAVHCWRLARESQQLITAEPLPPSSTPKTIILPTSPVPHFWSKHLETHSGWELNNFSAKLEWFQSCSISCQAGSTRKCRRWKNVAECFQYFSCGTHKQAREAAKKTIVCAVVIFCIFCFSERFPVWAFVQFWPRQAKGETLRQRGGFVKYAAKASQVQILVNLVNCVHRIDARNTAAQ